MDIADVSFLCRSPNRVAVLAALAAEPCDRRTLRDRVDASRVTVGRILSDLEDRGWVRRDGTDYTATTAGRVVAAAVDDLQSTLAAADRLGPLLDHLPVEDFDFDLRALADAEVVTPTPTEPTAHVDRISALFDGASDVSMVVSSATPGVVTVNHGRVVAGDQQLDAVATPAAFEVIRDHETMATQVAEMVDTGNVQFYERETVPFQFGIFDDVTAVSADGDGVPSGIVVSDDEAVEQWAHAVFERLRADATCVEAFTA